ncbi:hypothetical protein [Pararhizobium sp.]|uniref:hypothetical protein n=1 Tax=Pararhizobium sp. TaxID=1977563 RepID=UPI0027222F95|nr:hypothetical protein [Pararhizobium sp.]MDO9419009.1 hypothetical protein [Pararhizobium sp.]
MSHPKRRPVFDPDAEPPALIQARITARLPFAVAEHAGLPGRCCQPRCRRHRRCGLYHAEARTPFCFLTLDDAGLGHTLAVWKEAARRLEDGGLSWHIEMAYFGGKAIEIAAAEALFLSHPPGGWEKRWAAIARRKGKKDRAAEPWLD